MQKAFERDARSLANTIEEMGNPFTENSCDLLALDSRDIADPAVIDTVRQIASKSGLSTKRSLFLIPSRRTIFPSSGDLQSERRQSHNYKCPP